MTKFSIFSKSVNKNGKNRKNETSGVFSDNNGFLGGLDVEFLIHELKDPLSVMETAVRMLLEKTDKYGPLTDRQTRTLKRALKSSQKARSLIGDLLEVGRSDAGCFQCYWFDAVATIHEVIMEALEATDTDLWEMLQSTEKQTDRTALLNQSGIGLNISADVCNLQLCQDEAKFRQILGNLIKNALQHRSAYLTIGMDCRDETVIIEVSDDGPGIEPDHQELIFNRYTRLSACTPLSRPGHGLGLAGARILARHMGGDITVRNNHTAGAVFCLMLPLSFKASGQGNGSKGTTNGKENNHGS
jgi:signal transduction histidine kinase